MTDSQCEVCLDYIDKNDLVSLMLIYTRCDITQVCPSCHYRITTLIDFEIDRLREKA